MEKPTLMNKVALGLLCALEVYQEPEFSKWTKDFLSGKERKPWIMKPGSIRAAQEAGEKAKVAALWAADAANEILENPTNEKFIEEAVVEAMKLAIEVAAEERKSIDIVSLVYKAREIMR